MQFKNIFLKLINEGIKIFTMGYLVLSTEFFHKNFAWYIDQKADKVSSQRDEQSRNSFETNKYSFSQF